MSKIDDIKRRLFANPIFWVDKMVALQMALDAGEVDDMNRAIVEVELKEAREEVANALSTEMITQAEVDAEVALQRGGKA